MKTFVLEEDAEEKYNDNFNKREKVSIDLINKKKFNYIVLTNPNNSKYICMINGLELGLKESNRVCFFADEYDAVEESKIEVGAMKVVCKYRDEENLLEELDNYMMPLEKPINIIKGRVFILIPGGNLFIKLEKSIKEANLGLICSEHEI